MQFVFDVADTANVQYLYIGPLESRPCDLLERRYPTTRRCEQSRVFFFLLSVTESAYRSSQLWMSILHDGLSISVSEVLWYGGVQCYLW